MLLGIKHVQGSHTGDNLAYYFTKLIEDYRIKDNLDYFMLNNAENMNTIVKSLYASLDPQFESKERRLRCIDHIINFITKAFLLEADNQHYEFDDDSSVKPEDIKKF